MQLACIHCMLHAWACVPDISFAWQDVVLAPIMEKILLAERAMLYTLGFDLAVDNPINVLSAYLKKLGLTSEEAIASDTAQFYNVTYQMILERYLESALHASGAGPIISSLSRSAPTSLWLRYEVRKIVAGAMACIGQRAIGFKIPLPEGQAFCDFFDVTQAEIDGELHAPPHAAPSFGSPLPPLVFSSNRLFSVIGNAFYACCTAMSVLSQT